MTSAPRSRRSCEPVTKRARLGGATGRVVLGIKVKDDLGLVAEVGRSETEPAVGVGQGEVGGGGRPLSRPWSFAPDRHRSGPHCSLESDRSQVGREIPDQMVDFDGRSAYYVVCAMEQRLARQAHNLEVEGPIPTGAIHDRNGRVENHKWSRPSPFGLEAPIHPHRRCAMEQRSEGIVLDSGDWRHRPWMPIARRFGIPTLCARRLVDEVGLAGTGRIRGTGSGYRTRDTRKSRRALTFSWDR